MRRVCGWWAAALIGAWVWLAAAPSSATTLVEAGLPELYGRAALVVEGVVGAPSTVEVASEPRIFTEWTVAVDKVWKGSPTDHVTVRHPGGKTAGGELVVEGMPQLQRGESALLFLEPVPTPEGTGPRYLVLGMWQGRFTRSADGRRFRRDSGGTAMISPRRWCTGGEGRQEFDVDELRGWLAQQAEGKP